MCDVTKQEETFYARTEAQLELDPQLQEVLQTVSTQNVVIEGLPKSGKTVLAKTAALIAASAVNVEYDITNQQAIPLVDLQGYTAADEYKDEVDTVLRFIEDNSQKLPPVLVIDEISPMNIGLVSRVVDEYTRMYKTRIDSIAGFPHFIFNMQLPDEGNEMSAEETSEVATRQYLALKQSSHVLELRCGRFPESGKKKQCDLPDDGAHAYIRTSQLTANLRASLGGNYDILSKFFLSSLSTGEQICYSSRCTGRSSDG